MELQEIFNTTSGLWALASAVLVALLGQVIGGIRSRARRRHETKLAFVEAQLRDLYGPLHALAQANQHTYEAFKAVNHQTVEALASGETLKGDSAKTWKLWTDNVFQPSNRKMRDVILRGAHLFTSAEIPEIVLQFIAHVESYEALISTFEETGLSISEQIISFPEGFAEFISQDYSQAHNLGP